jgi:hypothetical protein
MNERESITFSARFSSQALSASQQVTLRSLNASLSSVQQQLKDDGNAAASADMCAGDGIASNVVAITFSTPGRSVFQATLSGSGQSAAPVVVAVDVTQPLSEPVGGAASKAAAVLGEKRRALVQEA